MDIETPLVLAPGLILAGLVLIASYQTLARSERGWHHSAAAWASATTALCIMLLVWAIAVFGHYSYDCVWEGLADGPMPVECRR